MNVVIWRKSISSNNTEQFKFDFEEIGQNRKMYYIYFIPKKKNERKTQIQGLQQFDIYILF